VHSLSVAVVKLEYSLYITSNVEKRNERDKKRVSKDIIVIGFNGIYKYSVRIKSQRREVGGGGDFI